MSAISGSEQAALGALGSDSGYNFPSDFSTIMTQFTDNVFGGRAKMVGNGDVTLIPKIDESITSEQIIASQMWLDNLYELLDVESPALKDRIVFYLANLPEELKSNFQAQAFGIADILGINEHSFLTSGLAQQVAGYLQTLPAEVETYLTLVATPTN